jgi:D-glycero-D-manno-heptose 1,7-bisphosphate phosphatase
MTDASSLARAVFLDRDGTINVERDYLHRSEDFAFIPGAPAAIRLLREAGYRIVVVTNQSGIARGYYDEAALHRLHRHMDELLAREGAAVDAWYHCPHHPDGAVDRYRAVCDCRKPLPGMLLQAAADLQIELSASYIIGDKLADVEAGLAAGCRPVLVKTGYGTAEEARVGSDVPVFSSIVEAARWIVSGR